MSHNGVYVIGSASAFGSRTIPSEQVDEAFGMPTGKLRTRAGILSLAYAEDFEDELSLAMSACAAFSESWSDSGETPDWIVTTSETYHAYPSLAAALHSRLQLPESCAALDVGSGCLALLQALSVAQALIRSGAARRILVASADVHSRTLAPGRVKGEFGGLFGDGACALLLSGSVPASVSCAYRLGEFHFGCASPYADAIGISQNSEGNLDVKFDGEALSRVAVSRMEEVLTEIEGRSGISRSEVGVFATHQPNPRLVNLLAKQLGVPLSTFPQIAVSRGNLGSSTCGAALEEGLRHAAALPAGARKPILMASLGPGLLFGGGWMEPAA